MKFWPLGVQIENRKKSDFTASSFVTGYFASFCQNIFLYRQNCRRTSSTTTLNDSAYPYLLYLPNLIELNLTMLNYICHNINPRPAGGGVADSAPCLTPERMVEERRGTTVNKSSQQDKSEEHQKFCLKRSQVRSGSGQRSKLQVSTLLASEPNWRSPTE